MYIKVKITTKARKEVVDQTSNDHFDISLKEKAENNRANNRLIEIMKERYPNSIIRIVSGHHSPSKILSVEDKTMANES